MRGRQLKREVDLIIAGAGFGGSLMAMIAHRLGLSVVIEQADGSIAYWALAHPPGRPDFHHADCLACEVMAPQRP